MSGLALAARLARREVRRRPGRTALVALLVALPVAGMVVSVVLFRVDQDTADEDWQRNHGNADAVVSLGSPEEAGAVLDALPPGARVVWTSDVWTRVRAADARSSLRVVAMPPDDPMFAGQLDLLEGRVPASADEVALAPSVARAFDVGVGDRLSLTRPEIDVHVVGLVEDPTSLRSEVALVVPGGDLLAASPDTPFVEGWVDLPADVSLADLAAVPDLTLRESPPDPWSTSSTNADQLVWTYVIGAVVLVVVGIVIAAAFATGARRQLVTLGQLSASGAPGPVLRATLVLQGTVTGLVGALAGLALAAAVLAAGRESVERMVDHRLGPYEVRPLDIALAAGVGVAAATIAALVPAWNSSRVPTLAALAGRRPLPPVRHRVTAAGAAAATVGLALLGIAVVGSASGQDGNVWAAVAIAGGVLELLGACAMAPAVVSRLEPLAGRTRGSWRLAARSLARQRSRTGGVVSAVAAAAGLAIAATALVAGNRAGASVAPEVSDRVVAVSEIAYFENAATPAPPGDETLAELTRILPGATRVVMRTAGDQAQWPDTRVPLIADDAVLDAFDLGDAVNRALASEGIVTLAPFDSDQDITLPDGSPHHLVAVPAERRIGDSWNVLVSPAFAEDLGLTPRDAGLALVSAGALTPEQVDDVEFLRSEWWMEQPADSDTYLEVAVRWREPGPTPVQIELILTGIAVLFAVLVVGTSLALAAAESREERDVLTVAGAGPGVLARGAGARAWLLAAIGAVMAVPVGMLPVAVYAAADDGQAAFVVPWRAIGLLVVALPAVVGAVALATSAAAQRLRPVRVSTAMFD